MHLLGHLIGLDFSASPHVAGPARRRGAAARARLRRRGAGLRRLAGRDGAPVVVVLDDLHWADGGSLDFMRHLLEAQPRHAAAAVLMTRPTLFERRPSWAGERRRAPAPRPEAARQGRQPRTGRELLLQRIADVPGGAARAGHRRRRGQPVLHGRAGQDADRRRRHRRRRRALARAARQAARQRSVPPTLTGVLQARLDALAPRERHGAAAGRGRRPRVLGPGAGRDRPGARRGAAGAAAQAADRAPRRRRSTPAASTPSSTTCCTR